MQTLEEAIVYVETVARANESLVSNYESDKIRAKIHRQLAAYLRELQERRKAPEIVRCGECERSEVGGCELYCMEWMRYTSYDGYCHRGIKRRTDEDIV